MPYADPKSEHARRKAREAARRYLARNRDKINARQREQRKQNRKAISVKERKYRLLKNYGITPEEKQHRIVLQDKRCAICGTLNPGGRYGVFCTDHDHVSGKVRGELCTRCNKGMGFFSDSPHVLRSAAEYLEKYV